VTIFGKLKNNKFSQNIFFSKHFSSSKSDENSPLKKKPTLGSIVKNEKKYIT